MKTKPSVPLTNAILSILSSSKTTCGICGFQTTSIKELADHYVKKHKDQIKKIVLEAIDEELKKTEITESGVILECTCKFKTNSKDEMAEHFLIKHKISLKKRIIMDLEAQQ